MTLPSITRNAPTRTPVERRPRSMSSTMPYERASDSASGMPIMSAANTTAVGIRPSAVAFAVERRRARHDNRSAVNITANIASGAIHANAASGLAYQLATTSTMPTTVNADAALNITELGTMSGLSFREGFGRLSVADATRPIGIPAPPERLGEAE